MLGETGRTREALAQLAWTLDRAGRIEEASAAYERAAEAGEMRALGNAGTMMEHVGRWDEAVRFYQRAAEAGDSSLVHRVVNLLALSDSIDDAVTWLRTRHQTGDSTAAYQLARLLSELGRAEEEAGHIDDALALYERAVEASGVVSSLHAAAKMLDKADRVDEAVVFLAGEGNRPALERSVGTPFMTTRDSRYRQASTMPDALSGNCHRP